MEGRSPTPLSPEEEKEAIRLRSPHYFVRQLSEPGCAKLHDRLCRINAKGLGRSGVWSYRTGKCEDPLVNDAAQQMSKELLERREGSLERAPQLALRRMSNSPADWENESIDALAKYAGGMMAGVKRVVLEITGAKVPAGWKVEDRGQVSGGMKDIDIASRMIAQEGARIADEQGKGLSKGKREVVAIYHVDGEQLGGMQHESDVGGPFVKDPTPTPYDELEQKQETALEQQKLRLRVEFVQALFASKPRHLELVRVWFGACRNDPEAARRLYKSDGGSDSVDHEQLLELLGPSWTRDELKSIYADLTCARNSASREKMVAKKFAVFVDARDTSQERPALSPDVSEADEVDATPPAISSKLRVKP